MDLQLSRDKNGVLLNVRLKPRSRKNAISGVRDGTVQIEVSAPPIDNQANEAMLRVLAASLRIAKSHLEIARGEKSSDKTVRVLALDENEIQQRLTSSMDSGKK
jgi:uncharacterized protein (TIGR00251 family)